LALVAVTAGLSLLFAAQRYAGGPIRFAITSKLYDLALSPDGSLIAAGAGDGTVYLWDIESPSGDAWAMRALSGHSGAVVAVAFAPDGSTLVSAGHDGTVRLWRLESSPDQDIVRGHLEQVLDAGEAPLNDAALAADGSMLATVGEDGIVRLFDMASGEMVRSIGPNENPALAVALNSDGTLVAAGDGAQVQIWDARAGNLVRTLKGYWEDDAVQEDWLGHDERVTALAFSPDGEILASGSADKTVVFWDLETSEVKWTFGGQWDGVTRLVFDQEGSAVLSASKDTKFRTVRLPGGKSTGVYEGHLSAVNGVAYGPPQWPDTILTAGSDGTVRMWDTANQRVVHLEWSRTGLQHVWGDVLSAWLVISGVLGLVCLWGLWRLRTWSHLLALGVYLVGPVAVLGLPLLEALSYPLSTFMKLQVAWPLLALAGWYTTMIVVLTRERVAGAFQAPELVLVLLYSVLRRFNLDVSFMGHFFSFIMAGAWITLRVSAFSIVLAVALALLGAMGRLSRNPIANGVSSFYVSLIRGTPLLVQVYIWYLGLPRLGVLLPAELAGILALSVNYGAYMTETFRAGIQAIGKGQHEAAHAVGMTRGQTFRRIVLPQAFRIVIPPIGNDFIAMLKDSSLVSIITVWDLTFRATKIGRQNFRNIETFIIAAGFYWALTVVFQFLQGKLEDYMAR
jgi:polar amino acid transport system permease protein